MPADAERVDQGAEAGRPAIAHKPEDPPTASCSEALAPTDTSKRALKFTPNIYFDSTTTLPTEDTLITDTATDRHTSFYKTIQLISKVRHQSTEGKDRAQANIISLNYYRKFFPKNLPKQAAKKKGPSSTQLTYGFHMIVLP